MWSDAVRCAGLLVLVLALPVASVCPACMCPPNVCNGAYAYGAVPSGIVTVSYQFVVPDAPMLDPSGGNPQFVFAMGSNGSSIDGPYVVLQEVANGDNSSAPFNGMWQVAVGTQTLPVGAGDTVNVTLSGNLVSWTVNIASSDGTQMTVPLPGTGALMDVFYYSIIAGDDIPCREFPFADSFTYSNVVMTDGSGNPVDWAVKLDVLPICSLLGIVSGPNNPPHYVQYTWINAGGGSGGAIDDIKL